MKGAMLLISLALHAVLLMLISCCSSSKTPVESLKEKDSAPRVAEPEKNDVKPVQSVVEDAEPEPKPDDVGDEPPMAPANDVVRTPMPAKAVTKTEVKPKLKNDSKLEHDSGTEVYVVKKGDTLTSVARSCGCTKAELAKLNKTTVAKLANLRLGQRIKVPKAD